MTPFVERKTPGQQPQYVAVEVVIGSGWASPALLPYGKAFALWWLGVLSVCECSRDPRLA